MLAPIGTGFFVSRDGWFITAAHVITENGEIDGKSRADVNKAWLQKEQRLPPPGSPRLSRLTIGSELIQGVFLDLVISPWRLA